VFVPPRYSETEARRAIALSDSYSEALRRLGMTHTGRNNATLAHYARDVWKIATDHFGHRAHVGGLRPKRPWSEILVEGSTFGRKHLKRRLFADGLKSRACELCGQGEEWHGRRMALILDHINGVANDHRIENLRIVCPNCAATLDTHCGRQNRIQREPQACLRCGLEFEPRFANQRYCSRYCGSRWDRSGIPLPKLRRVERPPYPQLMREIQALGYVGTGRRHGVSDNAVRKWVRSYEREQQRAARLGLPNDDAA
jgi:hypothetical protein